MSTLASLLLRSARLVVPAAAALSMIGSTAALAAPAKTPTSAPFTWHTLKLLNGWQSAAVQTLQSGTPAWARHDGVIYLRGAVESSADISEILTTLPKQARPAHNLYLQVFTDADVPGTLLIGSSGVVEASSGNSAAFTSLAGVSYPTSAIKSHPLTLKKGWASSQPMWGSGNPAYALSSG